MADFNTYNYTPNHNLPYPNNKLENIDLIENITKLAEAVESNLDEVDDEQTTQNEAIQANADGIATNTEDITALKAENEYLQSIIDQLPSVSGTGESVTLEPTIAAKIRSWALKGNLSQKSYEGYNLLKLDNTPTTTINGITYNITDNIITLNGQATTGFAINLTETQPVLINDELYTLKIEEISGTCELNSSIATAFRFIFYANNNNTNIPMRSNTIGNFYSRAGSPETPTRLWLGYDGGYFCTFTNYKFKLLLVKGNYNASNVPAWEPYVGRSSFS